MKERMKKILSLILVAGLMFGAIKGTVYAINNENKEKEAVREEQEAEIEEVKTDGASIYIFTEEDGKVLNVIATDDILFEADVAEDKIHKEIPLEINVKYILDGKDVKPEELAGKSGHLVIRYEYKNNQSQMMNVNGYSEKIYVPYAMVTGIIFEDETCKNIEVVNGKMIDDGSRTVVAGIAFPGLQSNLKVNKSDIDIPEYVEISADVENYEHPEAMTIATSQMFANLDTSTLNDVDGLKESMDKLTVAMDQLMDGSRQLYDGLTLLSEKSSQLKEGVDQLYDGSSVLKDGVSALDGGASDLQAGATQLVSGLETLTGNNATLTGGAKQVFDTLLSVGTDQLHANEEFKNVPALTTGNYTQVLSGIIAQLDKDAVYNTALQAVTAEVETHRDEVMEKVTAEVRKVVEGKVTAVVKEGVESQVTQVVESQKELIRQAVLTQIMPGVTLDQYEDLVANGKIPEDKQVAFNSAVESAVQAKIAEEVEKQMASVKTKGLIKANTDETMKGEEAQNNIAAFTEAKIQELIAGGMQEQEVQGKLAAAAEGLKSVAGLKTSLDSYNAFYNGIIAYTNGVSTALDGAKTLKAGTDTLKDGSSKLATGSVQLYEGINELRGNTPALIDGINQLKDGSEKLADGLFQLNEEGIDKIVEAYNGDIAPLTARVKATVNAAKSHDTFAGVSKDKDKEIKYIFRTK